uniref:Uncharacterized protein n=1 Tax=Romanomermis culicivorax TaxID=13658 RepID=A0A915L375_ROMCU
MPLKKELWRNKARFEGLHCHTAEILIRPDQPYPFVRFNRRNRQTANKMSKSKAANNTIIHVISFRPWPPDDPPPPTPAALMFSSAVVPAFLSSSKPPTRAVISALVSALLATVVVLYSASLVMGRSTPPRSSSEVIVDVSLL